MWHRRFLYWDVSDWMGGWFVEFHHPQGHMGGAFKDNDSSSEMGSKQGASTQWWLALEVNPAEMAMRRCNVARGIMGIVLSWHQVSSGDIIEHWYIWLMASKLRLGLSSECCIKFMDRSNSSSLWWCPILRRDTLPSPWQCTSVNWVDWIWEGAQHVDTKL